MIQVTPMISDAAKYSQTVKSVSVTSYHTSIGKTSKLSNAKNLTGMKLIESGKYPPDIKPDINLLSVLHHNKSENGNVFKPIGNRIVVPLKIPRKSKALVQSTEFCNNTTITSSSVTSGVSLKVNEKKENTFQFKNVIDMTLKSPTEKGVICNVLTPLCMKQEQENEKSFPQAQMKKINFVSTSGDFASMPNEKQKIPNELSNPPSFQASSDKDDNAELTCLSWLTNNKSKQILEILGKCNPDFPEITWSDDYLKIDDKKFEAIFTACSKIQVRQKIIIMIIIKMICFFYMVYVFFFTVKAFEIVLLFTKSSYHRCF